MPLRPALLSLLVILGLCVGAIETAAKAKRRPCPEGRFRLDGNVSLIPGAGLSSGDAVVLRSGQVTTDSGCPAARARIKASKKATIVRASWKACGGLRRVRLTAEIAASDCNQVKGTRKAKGIPGLSFVAVRSTCGDGYLDRGAPEGCDSGVGCAAIEQCDVGACTCTPLPTTTSTSATAPPSSSTTTTVPVPICGNGGVESGEPCDPFAEPSGCGRGQQCDLRDGRCTCAPIPDTVGTIVSFTPPPLPDPATLGLPASGAGTYLLTRAPGVELRLDPNLRDPVTAVARCARWITLCVSPPERTLDDCTRSAPHCATDEPWLESAECCPASCFAAYEVQRAAGVSPMLALERVLFDDGACVPGLRALLERD